MSDIKPFGKHIFLTGNVQVGKSTILREIIRSCPEKKIGGFFTKWINKDDARNGGLYLFPAVREYLSATEKINAANGYHICSGDISVPFGNENKIAGFRSDNYKKKDIFPAVFDTLGVEILSGFKDSDLILMDEIGVFEDRSPDFKKSIINILDGNTQVIGVVRNKEGIVTNAVRSHPNVRVIEVTAKNRDQLLAGFLNELK